MPIFNALIAFGFFHEVRVTGIRLVGVAVGFVGVALLVGAHRRARCSALSRSSAWHSATGSAACSRAGTCVREPPRRRARVDELSTLLALPLGAVQAPRRNPGLEGDRLGARARHPGTALAYLLFFGISQAPVLRTRPRHVPDPAVALAYGAFFLGERFGAAAFGGLALILGGVALGTGVGGKRLQRRPVTASSSGGGR